MPRRKSPKIRIKAQKLRLRVTTKRNGKRVYKSSKVLEKQIRRKSKRRKSKRRKSKRRKSKRRKSKRRKSKRRYQVGERKYHTPSDFDERAADAALQDWEDEEDELQLLEEEFYPEYDDGKRAMVPAELAENCSKKTNPLPCLAGGCCELSKTDYHVSGTNCDDIIATMKHKLPFVFDAYVRKYGRDSCPRWGDF